MDKATEGVIFVSLGSLIEPSKVERIGNAFVKILSNLPQRILLKWDSQLLNTIPDNFLVQKWMPQIDILREPYANAIFVSSMEF